MKSANKKPFAITRNKTPPRTLYLTITTIASTRLATIATIIAIMASFRSATCKAGVLGGKPMGPMRLINQKAYSATMHRTEPSTNLFTLSTVIPCSIFAVRIIDVAYRAMLHYKHSRDK